MSQLTEVLQGPIRLGVAAFAFTLVGVAAAFASSFLLLPPWAGKAGFAMTVAGVLAGFWAIAWGQLKYGKAAISGSGKAAKTLKQAIRESLNWTSKKK